MGSLQQIETSVLNTYFCGGSLGKKVEKKMYVVVKLVNKFQWCIYFLSNILSVHNVDIMLFPQNSEGKSFLEGKCSLKVKNFYLQTIYFIVLYCLFYVHFLLSFVLIYGDHWVMPQYYSDLCSFMVIFIRYFGGLRHLPLKDSHTY